MINMQLDMNDFNRLDQFNGKKSYYNHNFYMSRFDGTVIYIESTDEGYSDVYIVHVGKGGEKEFLFSGAQDEKGIIQGEYKRTFS